MNTEDADRRPAGRWLGPTLSLAVVLATATGFILHYRGQASRDEDLERSRRALRHGDLITAELLLEALHSNDPADAQATALLAETYAARGELAKAAELLQTYPPDAPQAEAVAVRQATWWMQLNRPGAAEIALRSGLDRFPNSVPLRQHLLDVLVLQSRNAEASALLEALWTSASKRPPLDRIWVLAKQFDLQFGVRETRDTWPTLQAFALAEPDNIDTFVAMAKVRLAYGENIPETLARLEPIAAGPVFHREATATLLEHAIDRGDVPDETVEALLNQWPSERAGARLFRLTGRWRLKHDDLKQAATQLTAALELDPSDWRTMHQLGTLLLRQSKALSREDSRSLGERWLEQAAQVKEASSSAKRQSRELRTWLDAPNPQLTADRCDLLQSLAKTCAVTHYWTQAERWCDVCATVCGGKPVDEILSEIENQRRSVLDLLAAVRELPLD